VDAARLLEIASGLGADVPFFLAPGPQLGEGDGRDLRPVRLPQDYWVLLLLPHGETKESTAAVYRRFDARHGERGYEQRRAALLEAVEHVERPRDLAELPPNDLASSPLAPDLRDLGAFRADVSGAGPTVYGLFARRSEARAAKRALEPRGSLWITVPAWYF
jgi:4-diphosphocytidyl-2-C-methyl-D-erythritol kinase